MVSKKTQILSNINKNIDYKYGFISDIKKEPFPFGLNEEVIKQISFKKKEPSWLLNFRLKAFRYFERLIKVNQKPSWGELILPNIDFNKLCYFSMPQKQKQNPDIIDPKLIETYKKLGIPIDEQKKMKNIAVDAIFDSVSVATTFQKELSNFGIIFSSFSDAVQKHPDLVRKYLGRVVPYTDNFYASLNASVFSDGSFCFIPKNIKCPLELSTYFRINSANIGQFERTLIIAEENSTVSYLEGCTAPIRNNQQLHAAIVEIIALENASVKYSTVQNWYPGNKNGIGGILNYVTKRGICLGNFSKISWIQVEVGSSITWKYPSVILKGDNTTGEFFSVAITNNYQQADTGTKMIHIGKRSSSSIISKGISAGFSNNSYRGIVKVLKNSTNSKNYTQCDSLILGTKCGGHTFPVIVCSNKSTQVEHEASTSRLSEDKIFYCQQRGISREAAVHLIVHGFCKNVLNNLPMEFAVETRKLLFLTLDDVVF
jgi:Fe-S cluster assembly protein SufB